MSGFGRHPLEVAIVVLTPPFLSGLAGVRLLRLLRLVRLMRLAQLSRQVFSLEGSATPPSSRSSR